MLPAAEFTSDGEAAGASRVSSDMATWASPAEAAAVVDVVCGGSSPHAPIDNTSTMASRAPAHAAVLEERKDLLMATPLNVYGAGWTPVRYDRFRALRHGSVKPNIV